MDCSCDRLRCAGVSLALLALAACAPKAGDSQGGTGTTSQTSTSDSGGEPGTPVVYAAGQISRRAAFWRDGEATRLPETRENTHAKSMFVADGQPYFVANCGDRACYWHGDHLVMLSNKDYSRAEAIWVDGEDVYVAGDEQDESDPEATVLYWKNDEKILLEEATEATAITVDNGNVYVGGLSGNLPCVWENGTRTVLPTIDHELGGWEEVMAIAVHEGELYVGGVTSVPVSDYDVDVGWYWHAGLRYDLIDGDSVEDGRTLSDLFVDDSGLYIVGGGPALWHDGVETALPVPANATWAAAKSVHRFDGVVYVGGYYADDVSPYPGHPAVWRDLEMETYSETAPQEDTGTSGPTSPSGQIHSIFVAANPG